MKIMHEFYPSVGGNQIQVYEISRRQAKHHSVIVYTTDPWHRYPRQEIIEGVHISRFDAYAPFNAYYISLPLFRAMQNVRGDVLHVHSYAVATSLLTFLALRGQKNRFRRVIFTPYFHEVASTPFRTFLHKFYDRIQKVLFFWADRVICLSEHERKLIHTKFKVPKHKLIVIPAGLNPSEFERVSVFEKEYDFEILYAGRIEKFKNIHWMIPALDKLIRKFPGKRIHFTVIGNGGYKVELQRLVKKAALENYVTFKDFVLREELIRHYKRADVFVSLSNYESFGITIIEALAAGTPVIISNLPPIKHVVKGNGFVISDLNQLPEKLESIMTNKIKVNFDVTPYTWDTIERQTTKLYF